MKKKKRTVFEGCATALVTPFSDGEIDYDALGRLIDYQLSGGVDAISVLGTTGEAPTVTEAERRRITAYARERTDGKIPLIVGVGSNDTTATVKQAKAAEDDGADALLVVAPYYNKPTERGIIRRYLTVAESTSRPIIVYNVPSRCGVDIGVSAYSTLAEHKNIVAVKEASTSISKIANIISAVAENLDVYSGNDDMTVPVMSLGGKGVVSVASNIMPREVSAMCRDFLLGNVTSAKEMQLRLMPIITTLFSETNPIPVKTALDAMGLISGELRLPLAEMDEANKVALIKVMTKYGFI